MQSSSVFTINLYNLIMAMNIIDIAFDAWILTLPMPVIKSLHMTLTRKIAIASVFLLGALYVSLHGKAL